MRARTLVISGAAVATVTLAVGCGSTAPAHHEAAPARARAATHSTPPARHSPDAPASPQPAAAAASPPAASTPAPAPVGLTCTDIAGVLQPLVKDMNAQDHAYATIVGTGVPLTTMQSTAAGAWTSPGAYSDALDNFITDEGSMTPDNASVPDQLSGDVAGVVGIGTTVQQDVENVDTGEPLSQAWPQFQQSVVAVATDCGVAIAAPWS